MITHTAAIAEKKDNSGGFKLLRHFTITALVSIAVAAVLLSKFHQQTSEAQFLDDAKEHHLELARVYRNFIWPNYGDFLLQVTDKTVDDISKAPLYKALHKGVGREIVESRVLKLKIFNHQGLTVYSSDPAQIGQIKKGYPGFEASVQGAVVGNLSFREKFDPGDHGETVMNKHVYSSYIPVFDSADRGTVVAVMELYSDITQLVEAGNIHRIKQVSVTLFVMLVLFAVLFVNVKRADKKIKEQERIQEQMKEQARWQANHDELTGLSNRNHFKVLLSENLQSLAKTEKIVALMFIDLDYFKPINDVHGHRIGDLVLQEVAKRMQKALPVGAVVARLGGDEFTAFFKVEKTGLDLSPYTNKVLEAIATPFQFDDVECFLSASIGVTYSENPDIDTDVIIAEADSAMYLSKRSGHGNANVYQDSSKKHAA